MIASLLFHVLFSDGHISVYVRTALSLSFCLFYLLCLCKINSDWSIRLLICCIWEKVMQCSTQLLHTPGIWVRGHVYFYAGPFLNIQSRVWLYFNLQWKINFSILVLYKLTILYDLLFYLCLFYFYTPLSTYWKAFHTCASTNKIIMTIPGCKDCQSGCF